jgi:23S rRNA pseudouridine2605 synthase
MDAKLDTPGRQRLQRVLAAAGVGSRRACEEIILAGRVRVNGGVVSSLPVLVNPTTDRITVDGRPILQERRVYLMLHKPAGVVCTQRDPAGRRRAVDLLPNVRERVYPVGRLDAESTGLLLMTNDGEWSLRLTHPRYGVPKTYRAEVAGRLDESAIERMRRGVWLSDGKTAPAEVSVIYQRSQSTIVEITLREGRNREIRRMLARLGHKVYRLHRIKIGPLSLRGLPVGGYRPLHPSELAALRRWRDEPSPMRLLPHPARRRTVEGGRSIRGRKPGRVGGDRRRVRRGS